MENLQREDWYDDSEQGRKAIAIGLKHTPERWANYDWTKAAGADFDWPDIDSEDIGKLEPWLCLQVMEDGSLRGWQDLNAIPDGDERRLEACARCLGMPADMPGDYDEAMEWIEAVRDADDLEVEAQSRGFKCNDIFSYEDHLDAVEARWEEERRKAWGDTQDLLDDQMAQLKQQMDTNIAAKREGGELDPIQGVSIEDWAAANAKMVSGTTIDEILGVLQIEKPAWDEINAEWNARMSRDASATIATVYGNAFQNPNIGRFAGVGSAPAAGAGGGEPCDFETWVKVGVHMNKATEQGLDPQTILASHGMGLNDWSAAGAYWSVEFTKNAAKYFDLETKLRAKYEKEYAGGSIADDIEF